MARSEYEMIYVNIEDIKQPIRFLVRVRVKVWVRVRVRVRGGGGL